MDCDVLVIGSGIAGITAAIEAARAGAKVCIASAGKLFSGSSFYPGTWGLGLIGPEDASDEQDLIDTICRVGCGAAKRELVEAFVHDIRPAIAWLEDDLGVELKRPASEASAREVTFIPCFDHKQRLWRGITRESFERAATAELERLGVEVLEHRELMDLIEEPRAAGAGTHGAHIGGAALFNRDTGRFEAVTCAATVLAAGGTGGLFERSLTSGDVLSSAHGIALAHGCELVNIEFMQMMPGLVSPKRGLVFNEKTFRYARFAEHAYGLPAEPERARLLEMRSGYGPFTARLDSRAIDLAIDAAGPEGLALTYRFPEHDVPEFVQTFSTWLEREHGIGARDTLRIAMYAHAANGGIRIDAHGSTGVPGLFACGEVTGGMHGADRIGGLSSANGLVFGRRAGRAAAGRATAAPVPAGHVSVHLDDVPALSPAVASQMTAELKRLMSAHCMINRTEAGLTEALAGIERLQAALEAAHDHEDGSASSAGSEHEPGRDAARARGARLRSQLTLAHAMTSAMLARTESCGSHYRADEVRTGK